MSSVVTINDSQFDPEVLEADRPVLAYFWASWCGPCRLVSPTINSIASEYGDRLKVVKLEVDPNPQTVAKYKVEGVPAIRLFINQEVVESLEGAIGKDKLKTILDSHLN
jgi:thioredoxin 1